MFADGKAPDAFRTIGEVSTALNLKPHVLRYWEAQFPSLRPVKRNGGRRYYRPEDITLIVRIDRLVHHEGYTLKGAKAVLAGTGELSSSLPATTDPVSGLITIRNLLAAALHA